MANTLTDDQQHALRRIERLERRAVGEAVTAQHAGDHQRAAVRCLTIEAQHSVNSKRPWFAPMSTGGEPLSRHLLTE